MIRHVGRLVAAEILGITPHSLGFTMGGPLGILKNPKDVRAPLGLTMPKRLRHTWTWERKKCSGSVKISPNWCAALIRGVGESRSAGSLP